MGESSRTRNTIKNIIWGYVGNFVTMLVQFASRTVFIYTIGVSFLGINGLFTSVLGLLSLSELGIGTAINFSLYKPVANGDREKVKSLMKLYRNAYRIIALTISVIGLALIPFLPKIISGADGIPNITLYYIIFLFNTVSSYFVSYKYGLVNAEQKGYIINNFNSIATVAITIGQICALLIFHNYLVYLLTQAVLQLAQKIGIGIYLDKKYSYLKEKNVEKLSKEESGRIKKDVFALVLHKLGDVCVNQTDNIIISTFINVTLVGLVSNYNMVITSVTGFINIIFNSVAASIGNLVALEGKEKQEKIFNIYNFIGFWVYGFSCVCFFVLFQPFITLWIGADKQIDLFSLTLIIVNQYIVGQRIVINNMKTAGGIFDQDKYVALIQAAVNLVISVICVKIMGLPGVYIGTIASGLIPFVVRPIIMYKYLFQKSAVIYFAKNGFYFLLVAVVTFVTNLIVKMVVSDLSWIRFVLSLLIAVIVPNLIFSLVTFKTVEFKELLTRSKQILRRTR